MYDVKSAKAEEFISHEGKNGMGKNMMEIKIIWNW